MKTLVVGTVAAFLVISALLRAIWFLSAEIQCKQEKQEMARLFLERNCGAEIEHSTGATEDCHRRRHIAEQSALYQTLVEALEPWGVATWLINEAVLIAVVFVLLTSVFLCLKKMETQSLEFSGPLIAKKAK